jgi:hypothetical protein
MSLQYRQEDFSGGMNLFDSELKLAANEYALAYNVRIRSGELQACQGPVEDTDAPRGLKQGLYGFDRYVILFNNGAAWYRDIVADGDWTQIDGFAMNTTVTRIYAEAVPAATSKMERALQDADRVDGSSAESNVNLKPISIYGTLAGLVCQDGTTQPWLINALGEARQTQKYTDWTKQTREYVPIGKQMRYVNGILFVVSPDGVTLLRSVTNRPLDFVVNITISGDKGGDASTTSYNVGVNPITCLAGLNSGELFVGTSQSCHPVEFNYEKTIFAEPTFLNRRSFAAGVVNHFSFIDILSDYTFIDYDGMRSFNAISSLENEGRNSIFSSRISKAFSGIKQGELTTAAVVFDNYSIFAVTTIYGNVLAIYDNTRLTWVCFDNLGISNPIKQFAVANQSTAPILYAITADKVYKLYSSPSELEAQVYLKALTSGKPSSSVKLDRFWAVMDGATTAADISVTEIVNNVEKSTVERPSPVGGKCDSVHFNFISKAHQGWKVQPKLTWQNEGKIPVVEAHASEVSSPVTNAQRANTFT